MSSKKETILKYLSGTLTSEEEKAFLNQMEKDGELKALYEQTTAKLNALDLLGKEKPVDGNYFPNLLPRAKQKLETAGRSKAKFKLSPSFAFALFSILSLLFFSSLFNSSFQSKIYVEKIPASDGLTPAQAEMVNFYLENQLYSIAPIDSLYNREINLGISGANSSDLLDYYETALLNDNDLFNIIDDNEYNSIYTNLKKLKLF